MSKQKQAAQVADFTKFKIYSDPQLSPSGDHFAFVSTNINDEKKYYSNIHLYDRTEGREIPWTFGDKDKNTHPRFSPCGKFICFQSNRSGRPQIWLMSTEGGEARQITTFTHGAMNPHWSKDGRYIIFSAFLAADDDPASQKELSKQAYKKLREEKAKQPLIVDRIKYKSDARGFHDDKYLQIILYDLNEQAFTQVTKGEAHHQFEDLSPDGQYLLFSSNLNETADLEVKSYLYTVHLGTKELSRLTDMDGVFNRASYSPSGQYIAYYGHEQAYKGASLTELYILNLKTKERTCLSESWDFPIGDYMIGDSRLGSSEVGPLWSADEKEIYFIGTRQGATGLFSVTLDQELTTLYEDNNHVFGFSYHQAADSLILGISTPTNPGDFFSLHKESREMKQLTFANEAYLSTVALSEPEEVTVTAEDGWDIQAWLLKPYHFTEGKKYPLILEIHGGPHAMYGQTYFHEMQLLAAQGYVVLYTNPRGSHGYGQNFVDAVRGDYGGKDYTDLMTALDTALEKYSFIDESRLGVTGGSYGGFMTNWIVGHSNRFKAAVTQRSISNWLSFYGVSDIGYFFTKWELGVDITEDPKKLWDFSPLKYAEQVETPLLILHGEHDYRCPIEQAEQLFISLKQLNKTVEFVRFPKANHELSRSGDPSLRIERLKHICRWFEQYL